MTTRVRRVAVTLLELLLAIGVIAVLITLLLPAVQKVRGAAAGIQCLNNLRQLGLAMHQYHNDHHSFPCGHRSPRNPVPMAFSGWTMDLLPYVERRADYEQARVAYAQAALPFADPPHTGRSRVVALYACPADPRSHRPQVATRSGTLVGLTSYLGVSGRNYLTRDGVLFQDSRISFHDVTDGTSNTLLLGERPPSADLQYGWWYAGAGQARTGSGDLVLGVREVNLLPVAAGSPCGPGAYAFQPSSFNDPCGMFHFWSPHTGGANFAFCDGAARHVTYASDSRMPAASTRASGEPASEL